MIENKIQNSYYGPTLQKYPKFTTNFPFYKTHSNNTIILRLPFMKYFLLICKCKLLSDLYFYKAA